MSVENPHTLGVRDGVSSIPRRRSVVRDGIVRDCTENSGSPQLDRPALGGNSTSSSIRAGSGQRGSRTNHALLSRLPARSIFLRLYSKPKHLHLKRETERL